MAANTADAVAQWRDQSSGSGNLASSRREHEASPTTDRPSPGSPVVARGLAARVWVGAAQEVASRLFATVRLRQRVTKGPGCARGCEPLSAEFGRRKAVSARWLLRQEGLAHVARTVRLRLAGARAV
jgi:hypothetical protein